MCHSLTAGKYRIFNRVDGIGGGGTTPLGSRFLLCCWGWNFNHVFRTIIHRQICNFVVIACFLKILGGVEVWGKTKILGKMWSKSKFFNFFKISPKSLNMLKMTKCTCFPSFSSKWPPEVPKWWPHFSGGYPEMGVSQKWPIFHFLRIFWNKLFSSIKKQV